MLCMHARPQRRKDQFAPVRPRLGKWEHKRPQGAAGQ